MEVNKRTMYGTNQRNKNSALKSQKRSEFSVLTKAIQLG